MSSILKYKVSKEFLEQKHLFRFKSKLIDKLKSNRYGAGLGISACTALIASIISSDNDT